MLTSTVDVDVVVAVARGTEDVAATLTVTVVVDEDVTTVEESPSQEHADEYRIVPEQKEA